MDADDDKPRPSRRELFRLSAATIAAAQSALLTAELATPTAADAQPASTTCAGYIVTRLKQHGVGTLFGIPGATCDGFFAAAHAGGLDIVTTASDFEAGYAADGYARYKGLGAVSVTYGVGTMSLIGAISGAYTEHSPVVVVNGGPSANDLTIQRSYSSLFTHSNGREHSDLVMYGEVTVKAARAATAKEVPGVVDTAIMLALQHRRPVYIEINKDLWDEPCDVAVGRINIPSPTTGMEARAARDIVARLQAATRPMLLLGIDVVRAGLSGSVTSMVEHLRLPWSTTLLGKSAIAETTAGFVGVHSGDHATASVIDAVEKSDALVAIGCILGRQYRALAMSSAERMITVGIDKVRFGSNNSVAADMGGVIGELTRQPWRAAPAVADRVKLADLSYEGRRRSLRRRPAVAPAPGEAGLTYDETMSALSAFLDDGFVVVADTSLSMYPAADLRVAGAQSFVSNCLWQSIGYSLGAAVGVGLAQSRRPLVICGDGGFQTSAQSLSTMADRKIRAIIVVLDNGEYGIEQWLLDPDYFADRNTSLKPHLKIRRWNYPDLAKSMGFATAVRAATPAELAGALTAARAADGPALISAAILPRNVPAGL